jgi:DMSO reductase anchor subunit
LAALGAIATVCTTAMIYASLKPILDWSTPFTLPVYVAFSLATGAILLNGVLALTVAPSAVAGWLAVVLVAIAWFLKIAAWRHNDALSGPSAASATGLKTGVVRSIEWPHTQANYILKEMGYQVARKHAAKLRQYAQILAFALPIAAVLLGLLAGGGSMLFMTATALIAIVAMVPGVLTERWLFFAEARHTATLYYGYQHARTG